MATLPPLLLTLFTQTMSKPTGTMLRQIFFSFSYDNQVSNSSIISTMQCFIMMALLHIDWQLMRHAFNLPQSHDTRVSLLRHGCILLLLSQCGSGGLKTVTTTGMCIFFAPFFRPFSWSDPAVHNTEARKQYIDWQKNCVHWTVHTLLDFMQLPTGVGLKHILPSRIPRFDMPSTHLTHS